MAKLDDILAQVAEINTTTNKIGEDTTNIAADIERIAGGLTGGLTAAEADQVIADLTAAANSLKQAGTALTQVAAVTPEPGEGQV